MHLTANLEEHQITHLIAKLTHQSSANSVDPTAPQNKSQSTPQSLPNLHLKKGNQPSFCNDRHTVSNFEKTQHP